MGVVFMSPDVEQVGLGTSTGETTYGTTVAITDTTHPLTAGLPLGEVEVYTTPLYHNFIQGDLSARVLARVGEGDVLVVKGSWVYFGLPWGESLTEIGWRLFDRSVAFVTKQAGPSLGAPVIDVRVSESNPMPGMEVKVAVTIDMTQVGRPLGVYRFRLQWDLAVLQFKGLLTDTSTKGDSLGVVLVSEGELRINWKSGVGAVGVVGTVFTFQVVGTTGQSSGIELLLDQLETVEPVQDLIPLAVITHGRVTVRGVTGVTYEFDEVEVLYAVECTALPVTVDPDNWVALLTGGPDRPITVLYGVVQLKNQGKVQVKEEFLKVSGAAGSDRFLVNAARMVYDDTTGTIRRISSFFWSAKKLIENTVVKDFTPPIRAITVVRTFDPQKSLTRFILAGANEGEQALQDFWMMDPAKNLYHADLTSVRHAGDPMAGTY
jgi:hypothetical protein